jgi:pimeloyl-ACP methyl ester carboxylesterase
MATSDHHHELSRRGFTAGTAAVAAGSVVGAPVAEAAPSKHRPRDFGSVATAPHLPAGFRRVFRDRFVTAHGIRQHAVVGGDGPPLLLVHGWPENWYAWRFVMLDLARHFEVIAVDQRGIGLTDKPARGYDTATLANDLVALMDTLGYERFAVVGHDTGMIIGYALAADHSGRVQRIALAEVPGPPGVVPGPPYFVDRAINDRLWHIAFNRIDSDVTERLVTGREDVFFGYEFAVQAGSRNLPRRTQRYYFELFSDPQALRGSFGFYRAWDETQAQNMARKATRLTMPVLAIGGAESWRDNVGGALRDVVTDLRTVVVPKAGHWVAEQNPGGLLDVLTPFLSGSRTP